MCQFWGSILWVNFSEFLARLLVRVAFGSHQCAPITWLHPQTKIKSKYHFSARCPRKNHSGVKVGCFSGKLRTSELHTNKIVLKCNGLACRVTKNLRKSNHRHVHARRPSYECFRLLQVISRAAPVRPACLLHRARRCKGIRCNKLDLPMPGHRNGVDSCSEERNA